MIRKFLLMMAIAAASGASAAPPAPVKEYTPQEFLIEAAADPRAVILDVRTPKEYAEGHLFGAQNLDWLNRGAFDRGLHALPRNKTYYIYCRSGHRSHEAALRMRAAGLRVYDMQGGVLLYRQQGLPLQSGSD